MPTKKTALVAGASGLIGSSLLNFLLESSRYETVIVMGRRAQALHHPKLQEYVFDFEEMAKYEGFIRADDVFCALGTTRRKAGSADAFYRVDHDYPLALAQAARQNEARQFLLVSSLGANPTSKNLYLRTKGQLEKDLTQLNYPSLHILRPSLLIGARDQIRVGEDLARVLMTAFASFLPYKYRAIKAQTVAKFMELVANKEMPGMHIYESNRIRRIERQAFDLKEMQEKTYYEEI